ncbi:MAG: tetratricopeptide repeat protein [Pseudomonadota bacterium]
MRQIENAFGLQFTAAEPEHVAAFDDIVRAFLGFRPDIGDKVKALLAVAPEMPMAIAARGYFAKMVGTSETGPVAHAASERVAAMAKAGRLNPREIAHARALALWCAGDMEGATAVWEAIVAETPQDALALRLAHFTHFYSGDGRRIRDGVARALPAYGPEHPLYGFVQGMYAFGLEESGDYARAERHGKIAVGRNPADAWSVHAVAHAFEMTGRPEEGLAFAASVEPHWSTVNNFRNHLHWHRGLYLLERGRTDEVLALYDSDFGRDVDSGFYLDMLNAASMLWRLELHGTDVGDRWQALADVAKKRMADEELIFVSLHYMMALVSAGGDADIDGLLAHLEAWAAKPTTQGQVVADTGLALARAFRDMRRGRHAEAFRAIEPIRYDIDPVGGSHAQRDLFHMMLIDAAQKSGADAEALSLLAERVAMKPSSPWGWQRYAQSLEATGAGEAAREAGLRADRLLAH